MMARALRRAICRALIGVMLFAQLAVAAYACPDLASLARPVEASSSLRVPCGGVASPDAAMADMTVAGLIANCDQMPGPLDEASPNLCAEHCRYGQQSDQTATPTAPVAVLTSLYTVPAVPEASPLARPSAASDSARAAAATPLAILHCRFRY